MVEDLFFPLKRFSGGCIILSNDGAFGLGRDQKENDHGDQHVTGTDGRGEGEGRSSRRGEASGARSEEGCEGDGEGRARSEEVGEGEQLRRHSSIGEHQDGPRVGDLGLDQREQGCSSSSQRSDGRCDQGRNQSGDRRDAVRPVAQASRAEGNARGSEARRFRRSGSAGEVTARRSPREIANGTVATPLSGEVAEGIDSRESVPFVFVI